MRLEEMHPEEERLAGGARGRQPGERLVHDRPRGPLVREPAIRAARHPVTVDVEPAREAETPIERVGGDERAGGVARVVQRRGQRGHRRRRRNAVVARAVSGRVTPGQQARVRRQRDRRRREGAIEPDPLAAETVERRGPRGGIAVGAHVVGTQRVDRNQDEVRRLRRAPRRRRRPVAATGRRGREEKDAQTPHGALPAHRPIPCSSAAAASRSRLNDAGAPSTARYAARARSI